jgi:hypothetical protein
MKTTTAKSTPSRKPRAPAPKPEMTGRFAALDIVLQARAKGNSHEELLQRHSLKPARKRN